MAERKKGAAVVEKTAHFVIYDAATGAIAAIHHVTALPGVKVPGDAFVQKRVLACAAEALERDAAELRVLATPDAQTVAPGMRVDVGTRTVSKVATQRGIAPDGKTDGDSFGQVSGTLRSP